MSDRWCDEGVFRHTCLSNTTDFAVQFCGLHRLWHVVNVTCDHVFAHCDTHARQQPHASFCCGSRCCLLLAGLLAAVCLLLLPPLLLGMHLAMRRWGYALYSHSLTLFELTETTASTHRSPFSPQQPPAFASRAFCPRHCRATATRCL